MSDSYQRTPHRGDLRKEQRTGNGGKRPDSFHRSFFLLVLGCTIAAILAAGVVILIRVAESETDGMNALLQSLKILSPLLLVLVAAFVMRRKSSSPGHFSKRMAAYCAMAGLSAGGAIWVTSPTQRAIADKLLEDNRELFQERAGQLAACRAQLDDYPVGTLGQTITAEQLAEFQSVKMNLNQSRHKLAEGWNTLLAADTDFVRLKPGTDPNDIMLGYDRPKPSFRSPDTYEYASEFNGKVDELAEAVYGAPYLWRREAEELVETFTPLRYLVIVRAGDTNPPVLTGEQFVPGYFSGEAFCFDLDGKRLIAAFSFAATNSESVEYTYKENSSVTAVANTAMHSLREDLIKSAWPAFWRKFHQLADAAVSPNKNLELPFTALALNEAKLAWMRKQIEEVAREQQVQEELECLESGSGSGSSEEAPPGNSAAPTPTPAN